jgi:N-acetylglucosaminyl-diphospho-decaprenol L-rhamnosyltransferase
VVLSVIIVNYQVKYFLEQCLCSVQQALRGIDQAPATLLGGQGGTEIFVVDNHSGDGSLAYLVPKFPDVQFLSNPSNEGFAKANNRALALAQGDYVLFLNPDTLIGESSIRACLDFLYDHPNAGAVGARMVDGAGAFLPESKRGFPYPWAAFCKLFGLSALFPHSRFFSRYYLGQVGEFEPSEVDVLSGAFLFARGQTLKRTGGFDEQFFMYGEDIDLCYRIKQAGFANHYLPQITILHFKGESTAKDQMHTALFYQAMRQFIHKYPGFGISRVFVPVLELAIAIRKQLALWTLPSDNRPPRLIHGPVRCCLRGDLRERQKLEIALRDSGRIMVEEPGQAQEHIFCQGPGFSYEQIIASVQLVGSRVSCKIHGAGTQSLVGSVSKNIPGGGMAL